MYSRATPNSNEDQAGRGQRKRQAQRIPTGADAAGGRAERRSCFDQFPRQYRQGYDCERRERVHGRCSEALLRRGASSIENGS